MAGSEQSEVQVWVNGDLKKSQKGNGEDYLVWKGIDVSDWVGEEAQIRIADNDEEGWIAADHIMFSDILYDTEREHAKWVDWGKDFYAARTFRDFDVTEKRKLWMAWFGNWTYIHDVPTEWGGTGQSLPREIQLQSSEKGYRIVQSPVPELQQLRKSAVTEYEDEVIEGKKALKDFNPDRNAYEFKATFELEPQQQQHFGINLAVGDTNKVVLGYDTVTSNVILDRTNAGNVDFHSDFPTVMQAPYEPEKDEIDFHVFVDQLSIEVFVNNGEKVLTSMIFPNEEDLGVELFSNNSETTLKDFKAWQLNSIWEKK